MALEARSPANLQFGTLEVELRSGELRKKGVRIKLQDQPFQVLKLLLQRSGELVTRVELRTQIWPDVDHGVGKAGAGKDGPRNLPSFHHVIRSMAAQRRPHRNFPHVVGIE
jgi:hypothetical protein